MRKHPELGKKLQLLYTLRLNQQINNAAELSRVIKISRQAIGSWVKGTPTRIGDRIPDDKVDRIAHIFGVSTYWFTLPYSRFESKVLEQLESQDEEAALNPEKISLSLMPLTSQVLCGRAAELEALDRAWSSADVNVMQVVGFGGMGKSALINNWLAQMNRDNYRGAYRVYAWSFGGQYSDEQDERRGASESRGASERRGADECCDPAERLRAENSMIENTLEWFGDSNPTSGTIWSKVTRLAALIREKKTLFILDALDPLQCPPGPGKVHKIASQSIALLIRELATDMQGLCLISSRLEIADLIPYLDERVDTITLGPLNQNTSSVLLRDLGISANNTSLREAAKTCAGHPLSLTVMAEHLLIAHNGNLNGCECHESITGNRESTESTELRERMDGVARTYLCWFIGQPEEQLLYLLSLSNRAINFGELLAIIKEKEKGLTDRLCNLNKLRLRTALNKLAESSLITLETKTINEKGQIDCHPMLRFCISAILKQEQPQLWQKARELLEKLEL
ncbi:MAG: hypothetical protein ACR2PR_03840 [Pseudohongiellaceae bacterium]